MGQRDRILRLVTAGVAPRWATSALSKLNSEDCRPLAEILDDLRKHPTGRRIVKAVVPDSGPRVVNETARHAALAAVHDRFHLLMEHSYRRDHCRACAALDRLVAFSGHPSLTPPLSSMSEPDRAPFVKLREDKELCKLIADLNGEEHRLANARKAAVVEASAEADVRQALVEAILATLSD